MTIEDVAISEIRPAKYNPRKDLKPGDPAYDKLKKAVTEFDLVIPLVWNKRTRNLVSGHQRLKILIERGDTKVPVSVVDLDDRAEKAMNLALNKHTGEWDFAALSDLVSELDTGGFDMDVTGFGVSELEKLATWTPDDAAGDAKPKTDRAAELQREWNTELGQAWNIGRHRLFIGDSATFDFKADGVCTDPPYQLETKPIADILRSLSERYVVLCGDRIAFELAAILEFRLDFIWRHRVAKSIPTKDQHMPIFYHAHAIMLTSGPEVKLDWHRCDPTHGSIIETEREYEDVGHGHGKSAELFVKMLSGFAWKTVIDPFCGTGPTLLACELTRRTCTSIEIDPSTAAVALQRWRDSGLRPELAESAGTP